MYEIGYIHLITIIFLSYTIYLSLIADYISDHKVYMSFVAKWLKVTSLNRPLNRDRRVFGYMYRFEATKNHANFLILQHDSITEIFRPT